MKPRIAAIQMTSHHDVNQNLTVADHLLAKAAKSGNQLVVLPEMFALMGMEATDKVKYSEEFGHGPIQAFLQEKSLQYKIWIVGGTIPLINPANPKAIFSASLIFNDQGAYVARYDKIHLFDALLNNNKESYQESLTTTAGKNIIVIPTPFGRLGIAVCYDVRFPELFRAMVNQGVEIIALPTAFTHTTGVAHWEILTRARAIENQVYFIAAGQSGKHSNKRETYGHSMIIDPWGEIKASLSEGEGIVEAEVDLDYLNKLRKNFPVLTHRKESIT